MDVVVDHALADDTGRVDTRDLARQRDTRLCIQGELGLLARFHGLNLRLIDQDIHVQLAHIGDLDGIAGTSGITGCDVDRRNDAVKRRGQRGICQILLGLHER